jgi:acetyl esterase/lipase
MGSHALKKFQLNCLQSKRNMSANKRRSTFWLISKRSSIAKQLPIVLLIHGGGWVAGNRHQILIHANRLTSAGFAVLSIEYRLAPKFKHPAQLDDVRAAIDYIESKSSDWQLDLNQFVIWGYSAGGHLAALASLLPKEPTLRPKVCVAGGAPCDFTTLPPNNKSLVPFLGATRADQPQVYADASPLTHASADDPPVFFINGDSDLLVPIENSTRLMDQLKSQNVRVDQYVAKFQGHMATYMNLKSVDAAIAFVNQVLKEGTAAR